MAISYDIIFLHPLFTLTLYLLFLQMSFLFLFILSLSSTILPSCHVFPFLRASSCRLMMA